MENFQSKLLIFHLPDAGAEHRNREWQFARRETQSVRDLEAKMERMIKGVDEMTLQSKREEKVILKSSYHT